MAALLDPKANFQNQTRNVQALLSTCVNVSALDFQNYFLFLITINYNVNRIRARIGWCETSDYSPTVIPFINLTLFKMNHVRTYF